MTTGLQQFTLCVCLVSQCHCQFAAAAANADNDDGDAKVANDAVTVQLVLEISRMLFLAVTNAGVCCIDFMAYCFSACYFHDFMFS